MATVSYQLRPSWSGFTGGSITLDPINTFDVDDALAAGSGTITVDADNTQLVHALDQYPALQRSGTTDDPPGSVLVNEAVYVKRPKPPIAGLVPTLQSDGTWLATTVAVGAATRVYLPSLVATDGTTDVTTAIQAIIDASAGATILDFGDTRHTYRVSTLKPKSGQTYVGARAKLVHKPGSTSGVFHWPQSPRVMLDGCTWQGLIFQGEVNDAAFEADRCGIFGIYCHRMLVRDCEFYDFRSSAVHFSDAGDVTYENLLAKRCSNGEELQFNGGNVGRNALELIGSALDATDNTTANYEWTVRNCKVDNAGASKGGAGGIVTNMREAPYVRATIDGNWVYNCLGFVGIAAEGWARYVHITNNKVFSSLTGIQAIDTSGGSFGATQITDRLVIANNVVDVKNITPSTATFKTVTVPPGSDCPASVGIWAEASHSVVTGNVVRSTGDGLRMFGKSSVSRRLQSPTITGNRFTICNTDTANATVFGITISYAEDVQLVGNHVEADRDVATVFRDAYNIATTNNLTMTGNSSRLAGRDAIRLVTVVGAVISGGLHLNPSENVANSYGLFIVTDCFDIQIGGGITWKDDRATHKMAYGFGLSGAGANNNITLAHVSVLGWLTGVTPNAAVFGIDNRSLNVGEAAVAPYLAHGLPGSRISRQNAAPTSGTWTRGDVVEDSFPDPGQQFGWICTASGTPGTWKAFGTIAA